MTAGPRAAAPVSAPPFPPIEWVIRKRRMRLFVGGIGIALIVAAVTWFLFADAPPDSRSTSGVPLPGLDPSAADAALANAPFESFTELTWERMQLLSAVTDSASGVIAESVPAELMALHGKPVRATGFMVPLDPGASTLDFIVVPDMSRCWFCEAAEPNRTIYCRAAFGPIAAEYDRPVRAFGILDVNPVYSSNVIHSVVRMRVVKLERL